MWYAVRLASNSLFVVVPNTLVRFGNQMMSGPIRRHVGQYLRNSVSLTEPTALPFNSKRESSSTFRRCLKHRTCSRLTSANQGRSSNWSQLPSGPNHQSEHAANFTAPHTRNAHFPAAISIITSPHHCILLGVLRGECIKIAIMGRHVQHVSYHYWAG